MLEDLMDDDKIYRTNETLIPNFLRTAINDLMQTKKMMSIKRQLAMISNYRKLFNAQFTEKKYQELKMISHPTLIMNPLFE
jgi:hypothetical protein